MDQASLVGEIKRLQREDQVAREQWGVFCEQSAGGTRDPTKHDAASLQSFLNQYNSGARLATQDVEWAAVFKELQKKSANFRQAWANYCAMTGGSKDPNLATKDFMAKFVDQVCGSGMGMQSGMPPAMAAMMGGFGGGKGGMGAMGGMGGMGMGGGMGFGEPAAKRARMGMMGGAVACGGMMMPMNPAKQKLVDRIKAYQRMGQENKQAWGAFVDEHLAGTRDPARHEIPQLQQFITAYGVP